MPKKFIILAIGLMLLSGCGASVAPMEYAVEDQQYETAAAATEYAPGCRGTISDLEPMRETEPKNLPQGKMEGESRQPELPLDIIIASTQPQDQQESPHYFQMRRENREIVNDDGVEILCENRCYLDFYSENAELKEWVDQILRENRESYDSKSRNLCKYAEEVIREEGSDQFYSYSNYEDQALARHDERVASIISLSHVYSGGAHPNAVQTADNLDLFSKRVLRLEDVIYESGAKELEAYIQQSVGKKFNAIGVEALFDDYLDIISVSLQYGNMTPSWYFSHQGLTIFYNQYELGPYAAGIIKVEIPYSQLDGILKEEFIPEKSDDPIGKPKVITDAEGRYEIPLMIEPNGAYMQIGTDNPIYEVRVSEVFWLYETPVTQQMLISMDKLTAQDVLEITGGFDNPERSIALEYTDGFGHDFTYYVHSDGLSETP